MTCLPLLAPGVDHPVGWLCRADRVRRTDRWEVRYCFACRVRSPHRLWLTDDAWYDPEAIWRCAGCGQDRRKFPG